MAIKQFRSLEDSFNEEAALKPVIRQLERETERLELISSTAEIRSILEAIDGFLLTREKFFPPEDAAIAPTLDVAADKLRTVANDLYAQHNDVKVALKILDQCTSIAVSPKMLRSIDADRSRIKVDLFFKPYQPRFDEILELIAAGKIDESQAKYLQLDYDIDSRHHEAVAAIRVRLLIHHCYPLLVAADNLSIQPKRLVDSLFALQYVRDNVAERLHLLTLGNHSDGPFQDADMIFGAMNKISNSLEMCDYSKLQEYHTKGQKIIDLIVTDQENEETQAAVQLLGTASCLGPVYYRTGAAIRYRKWKWGCIGIAIFIFVFGSIAFAAWEKKSEVSSRESLNEREVSVITFLEERRPEEVRSLRERGHSDKSIAQAFLREVDRYNEGT